MKQAAHISSLDAITQFRGALDEYRGIAQLALANADSDISKTTWWLQHEQLGFWQREVVKLKRILAQFKSELYRAELQSRDERPSCAVERKNLQKAEARLHEAEDKIKRVKYWARMLDREHTLFRSQTQSLRSMLDRDLPRGIAKLAIVLNQIEAYMQTPQASDTSMSEFHDQTTQENNDDVETKCSSENDS